MIRDLLKEHRYFTYLLMLLMLSSCSMRYRNALFTSKSDSVTDTLQTVYVVNSITQTDFYRIRPLDVLAIRNLQDINYIAATDAKTPPLQGTTFRVETDGGVTLPAIGKVIVAGLSRQEAANKIQSLYKQNVLKEPIIDLSIVNLKVTLLGEFEKQGAYLLENENTSLIDMIGQAGGLSPKADPKTLKIIRGDRSKPEIIYVNLKNINSLANPKLRLQYNDIVYIEPLASHNATERINRTSALLQPALLIVNFALIIYNIAKK